MKKAGGKRKGAGRKALPFAERKTTLKLGVKNKVIDDLGGLDVLQNKLHTYIEELNKV